MNVFRNLYLTDRVFYILGGIVFLFFISFTAEILYYPALVLLLLFTGVLAVDVFLVFRRTNLSVQRKTPQVMSLFDNNKVTLVLSNLTDTNLRIKIIDELPYQITKRDFSITIEIKKGKTERLDYFIAPKTRGEYAFGNVNCFITSGFGLALKREVTSAEKHVVVYPSVILMRRQEMLALKHPSFTQGDKTVKKAGKSYEFDQIKNYVEGDDTRNINWKASSTLNKLMVNYFEDERSQQIYSIIDKSRIMKMPFGGLTLVDYAINATLAFSNIILKKQDKTGLICFSQKVDTILKADKGPQHLKKIMYALYKERYDYSEPDYEALYASIRKTISNRSLLFLYTNFDSIHSLEQNLRILKMINKYHTLIVVFFENTELEAYSAEPAKSVLEIYQKTIGRKSALDKALIIKELKMHGIMAIKCAPENLSTRVINKYLELKSNGLI